MQTAAIVVMVGMLAAAACGGGGNDNEAPKAQIGEGVYDATLVQNGASYQRTGSISFDRDTVSVFLHLPGDASVRFSGRLDDDSTLRVNGDLQITDVIYPDSVQAEATFSDTDGSYVVSGSFAAPDTNSTFDQPVPFTMRRPTGADAARFSGTYHFSFDPGPTCACTSTIDFDFTIDRLGYGQADATEELAPDGTVIASLDFPSITLSPQGQVEVRSNYLRTSGEQVGFLWLDGTLDVTSTPTTGRGDVFVGFFGPSGPYGSWSAERVSETPAARARP